MARDSTDRRVRRTRTMLLQAAERLIKEERWPEISVQALCEEADIARSSFYAHFGSKEALLAEVLERVLTRAEDEIGSLPRRPGRLVSLTWMVWHIRGNRELYRLILGGEGGDGLRRRVEGRFRAAMGGELTARGMAAPLEARRFVSAGLLAVLDAWLRTDTTIGAIELEIRLQRLAAPALSVT
ncbi:imidazole glycerol phosphate synthase subunit HisH [Oceanicola granulosus HTCC2516]|uniref:Imidazole glycerol phosphate synthase subunit HisH n=1 Tax=Oceanicola granulosus (strain ATCC BAA-861 / DSM 15982 / KCTC 12143 / HTCC2516) TaxID=314256 RepID=Q2CDY4_OCEGH|nr:TetR/AcrR family transcriptional regulator [Oceanicola granulosus]EAR50844.1 imidazole glycerol phosphate synthase subunit HisH [Oceanicola granulosus HTCC2516]